MWDLHGFCLSDFLFQILTAQSKMCRVGVPLLARDSVCVFKFRQLLSYILIIILNLRRFHFYRLEIERLRTRYSLPGRCRVVRNICWLIIVVLERIVRFDQYSRVLHSVCLFVLLVELRLDP